MSTEAKDKNWFQKLFGSMSADDRKSAREALESESAGNEPPAPSPSPTPPAPAPTPAPSPSPTPAPAPTPAPKAEATEESEEMKLLRARAAQADKLQEQIQAQLTEARAKEAETFAGSLVIGKQVMPAAKDKIAALYIQNAEDDDRAPLATGSRLENFKAMFTDLPKHTLTNEYMESQLPDGAAVLNPDAGNQEEQLKAAEESSRRYAARQNPKVAPLAAVK